MLSDITTLLYSFTLQPCIVIGTFVSSLTLLMVNDTDWQLWMVFAAVLITVTSQGRLVTTVTTLVWLNTLDKNITTLTSITEI